MMNSNFEIQISTLKMLTRQTKRSQLAADLGVLTSTINEWEKVGRIPEEIMVNALTLKSQRSRGSFA